MRLSTQEPLRLRHVCGGMLLGGFVGTRHLVTLSGPHPNQKFCISFHFAQVDQRWECFVRSREKAIALADKVTALHPRAVRLLQLQKTQPPNEPAGTRKC